jgi:hypothetical protein
MYLSIYIDLVGAATPLRAPTESAVPYITGPRALHIPQTTLIPHPQDHLHITYLGPMQAAGAGIALVVECGGKGSTAERERSVCV